MDYTGRSDLFEGLKIWQEEDYREIQGTYPVISLSFASVKEKTYAQTKLCAPRKLYVQVGMEDPVFDYHSAIPEAERVKDYFEAFGVPENYKFDVWEGRHTISDHDEGYELLFSVLG